MWAALMKIVHVVRQYYPAVGGLENVRDGGAGGPYRRQTIASGVRAHLTYMLFDYVIMLFDYVI